jgi:hypothetical protein
MGPHLGDEPGNGARAVAGVPQLDRVDVPGVRVRVDHHHPAARIALTQAGQVGHCQLPLARLPFGIALRVEGEEGAGLGELGADRLADAGEPSHAGLVGEDGEPGRAERVQQRPDARGVTAAVAEEDIPHGV